MRAKITTGQFQKTILAPQMQQSIEVLLLPIAELDIAIDQELQENPLLEIDEERTAQDKTDQAKNELEELINQRIRNYEYESPNSSYDIYNDENIESKPITKSAPLEDYLLQQLRIDINDPTELKIGEFIIGNLNEDGYLLLSCEELAQLMGLKNIEKIQSVLDVIQNFEPLGIASRDLKECLTTQIIFNCNGDSSALTNLVVNHLDELARKNYLSIARKTKMPLDEVRKLAKTIATLEPKPARSYRPINHNLYIKPDASIVEDENEELSISITNDNIPHLRINKQYQSILIKPSCTTEEKEFVSDRIKKAMFFIKSLEQRNQTITNIAQYILDHQRKFFYEGHQHLQPMILKDVAQVLERNESTISRAINNKYIDTPQGLYPMKYFFSHGVSCGGDEDVCSRSIKEEIKDYVTAENADKPFTDQDIYHHLAQKGMKVARRTISKYRKNLKILPSHLRKV